jgi:hypothetical protein
MKFFAVSILAIISAFGGLVSAQTLPRSQVAGNVASVDASNHQLSLKTDKGDAINISITDKTVIVHIPAGETDIKKGTKMALTELAAGDRVVAFVRPGADAGVMQASSMVVRTKADLAALQQKEQDDWKKRGTTGTVTEVDAAGKTITIKAGSRTLTVQGSDKTEYHRYSLDSAKPSDAKPSTLAEVKTGDQVNVLGNKSEDGTTVQAEIVYAGSFRQLAATIISVDAAAGEMKVTDLATKKPLTIRVTPDSTMKKLPDQVAQGLARRFGAGGRGGDAAGRGGAPGAGGSGAGGPGGGRPGGARGGDIGQMLDRLPALPLTDLKPKDAIMVSTTQGTDPTRVTAIMLLAGVEPILTAAPSATRDIMSGWNLSGGGGEGQ